MIQHSFQNHSTIVQQPFNNPVTILNNYSATVVQQSFKYRSTIV